MPMATRNPGDSIAAAHQNAIVDALKGTVGENLTVFFKGADRTSAAALVLGTDGNYFDVTGTVTITSISTLPSGTVIKLQFDGALLLTHNATTLILSGGANYTTAAGDVFEFISEGSGNWRETHRSLSAIAAAFGATPSLTFNTSNTAGTGTEFVRRNAQVALFDTTAARAISFADVGTTGTVAFAARRDHGHVFSVIPAIVASTNNVLTVGSTNGGLTWAAVAAGPSAGTAPGAIILGGAANGGSSGIYSQDGHIHAQTFVGAYGNTTVFSAASAAHNPITFTEIIDPDGMHDNSTNPSRWTPTRVGHYLVSANIAFLTNLASGNAWQGYLRKNGATFQEAHKDVVDGTRTPAATITGMFPSMNGTTDYIEATVYQDSGANQNVEARFSIVKVG